MRRGDVFRLRLGRPQGHEQSGVRYGVIVQSDALMRLSTVRVAPTSTGARRASFRPEIEINGSTTRVPVEQTVALLLVASSPGAPFGAKLAMLQRGDVLTGTTMQVLLAAVGSVTSR